MPILYVVLIILLVGVVVTVIVTQVPDAYLAAPFKKLILWGSVIAIVVWLIFLIAPGLTNLRIGH